MITVKPSQLSQLPVYGAVLLVLAGLYWVGSEHPEWLPEHGELFALVPVLFALSRYAAIHHTEFRLDHEKIEVERGVLFKNVDPVMLYRVKDSSVRFGILRLWGFGDVVVYSSDATDPELRIPAIPNPRAFQQALSDRVLIERARRSTGLMEGV